MKNFILIFNGEYYQFNTLEELKEFFVPNFNSLKESDIEKYLYEKIFGFSVMNNFQILSTKNGVYGSNYEIINENKNYENSIIIDNLDTYILSLCKHGVITLLEEKENRVYTKEITDEFNDDNYINVNAYADNLLLKIVGDVK